MCMILKVIQYEESSSPFDHMLQNLLRFGALLREILLSEMWPNLYYFFNILSLKSNKNIEFIYWSIFSPIFIGFYSQNVEKVK